MSVHSKHPRQRPLVSPESLGRALAKADQMSHQAHRWLRRAVKRFEGSRIVPFRGWLAPGKAVVIARAIEVDPKVERALGRGPRVPRMLYERFGTVGCGGMRVEITYRGNSVISESDPMGYLDVSLPTQTQSQVSTVDHAELVAFSAERSERAPLFGFSEAPEFGVVSDIDDTVLETDLTNPYKRFVQLLYSERRLRVPFEGITSLYQALVLGNKPIFYVSNSPWSLYSHVEELLDSHDTPKGPLLLRDMGLVERPFLEDETDLSRLHKQRALRRIFDDYPRLPFVLLGDSSRRDAQRYLEVAEAFPGRVAAIYIRHVTGLLARTFDLEGLKERARRAGVEFVVSKDTVTMAKHAESRGFIPRSEVHRVHEGKLEDRAQPSPDLASMLQGEGADPNENSTSG